MATLIPGLGTKGVYQLKTPFSEKMDPTVVYTCVAIRKFKDIANQDGDVFSKYYEVNGLTNDDYSRDFKNDEAIVTLYSDTTAPIYVPSSYIASFPSSDVLAYHRVILSVDMGMLPDGMDLTFAKTQIKNCVSDAVGVAPTVNENAGAVSGTVTMADHLATEAARKAAIKNRTTDYANTLDLTNRLKACQDRIAQYEKLLRDNNLLK